jgi:hypothetical protein
VGEPEPAGQMSALSTDCLDLDQTCPGTTTTYPDIISDVIHHHDDNNTTPTMMMTTPTATPLSSSLMFLSPSLLSSSSSLSSSRCTCLQSNDSSVVLVGSPARYRVRYREKMRKYHAVIRLNNSNSDLSGLDLSSSRLLGDEEGELIDSNNMYYTLDSRRLANKQKKSLKER